jgi:hypothetical protein
LSEDDASQSGGQEAMQKELYIDFESYAESIQGADVRIRLVKPTAYRWEISRFQLATVQVQSATEASGMLTEGRIHPAGWAWYLQASPQEVRVEGKRIPPGAAVLMPGCEFCFAGQGANQWYSLFIPTQRLEHFGGLDDVAHATPSLRVFEPSHPMVATLFHAIESRESSPNRLRVWTMWTPKIARIKQSVDG